MLVTTRRGLGVALVLALAAAGGRGDEAKPGSEAEAVEALTAIGGRVTRDEAAEGKPVVGLNLAGIPAGNAELKHVKALKHLKTLSLVQTAVTDVGLKPLADLSELQELRLDADPITDAGLNTIAGLTGLKRLSLSGTKVTDAGLRELKGLTKLEELRIGFTNVTDAGLDVVKGFPELRVLGLAKTRVTDAGLKTLAGLKKIEELRLDGTRVGDAGLKSLAHLKNLKSLNVAGTKVTGPGLDELAAAIPAVQIVPVRLKGVVKEIDFESKALGGARKVTVYLPPGHDPKKSYPVLYAADGFGGVACEKVEPLILSGKLPPLVIVGTEDAPGRMRQMEYIPGVSPRHFDVHEKFFCDEVLPWAEKQWGASKNKAERIVYGSSNSGPFALTMANRHPDVFGHVFAMMVYGLDMKGFESKLPVDPKVPTRYNLVVGSEDAHGIEENREVESILKKKGLPVLSRVIDGGGHSRQLQQNELPRCLIEALGR